VCEGIAGRADKVIDNLADDRLWPCSAIRGCASLRQQSEEVRRTFLAATRDDGTGVHSPVGD
jgi:hypothetical protein